MKKSDAGKAQVVIVGAGVFGLSTAYHLLQRGYKVTVLDRAKELPAKDGAGYDLNKGASLCSPLPRRPRTDDIRSRHATVIQGSAFRWMAGCTA